ncbi:MAG: hypothetical protein WDN75_19145 [Bacteroidota bacterium]
MNKLDELFKEKLASHSITPSTGAWDKVEAGLSKKNKGIGWLRWAAVFLLGMLMAGLFLINNNEAPLTISEKEEAPVLKDQNKTEQALTPASEKTEVKNAVSQNKKKSKRKPANQQFSPLFQKKKKKRLCRLQKSRTKNHRFNKPRRLQR